jgi:3-phosphoshikimate 1-carboxyvinyltransferase
VERTIAPAAGPLRGTLAVPPDKSISHRAVLFSALASGTSHVTGALSSEDVWSSIGAVQALGAAVDIDEGPRDTLDLTINGWGRKGPASPGGPIDCGNSGTTARLLLGLLAGREGVSAQLVGDRSLSGRPMRRVADPLATMGARIETAPGGTLPATVTGTRLAARAFTIPMASAQVKTALLLAGLSAHGRTAVTEPAASRDHTERMLPAYGVAVWRDERTHTAWIEGPAALRAMDLTVPGDPSSAAFWAVAAAIVPGSDVTLTGVSLNPTRLGFAAVLERMGANVEITPTTVAAGEPVGTIRIRYAGRLQPTRVEPHEVPSLVDEVPILAVAAARAEGVTVFEGVGELRVKESDRLAAICDGLAAFGVTVRDDTATLEVRGTDAVLRGADLDSLADHRLAMAWTIAGLLAGGPTAIRRYEAVAVSYPGFSDDLAALLG